MLGIYWLERFLTKNIKVNFTLKMNALTLKVDLVSSWLL